MSESTKKPASRGRPRNSPLPYTSLERGWRTASHRLNSFLELIDGHTNIPDAFRPDIVGHLWEHVAEHFPSGRIGEPSDYELKRWCDFDGPKEVLGSALRESGLIVEGPGGWVTHDWFEHTGKAYLARIEYRCKKGLPVTGDELHGLPDWFLSKTAVAKVAAAQSRPPADGDGTETSRRKIDLSPEKNQETPPLFLVPEIAPEENSNYLRRESDFSPSVKGKGYIEREERGPDPVSDLSLAPDDAIIPRASLPVLLSRPQLGHPAVLDALLPGAHHLAALVMLPEIRVWELKAALEVRGNKSKGAPWVAAVIANGRKDGWQPPPKYNPVKPRKRPPERRKHRTNRQAMAEAATLVLGHSPAAEGALPC